MEQTLDGDRRSSVRAWRTSRTSAEPFATPSVAAVMSCPLVTIPSGATLQHAREVMRKHGVHHLLLEDRGRGRCRGRRRSRHRPRFLPLAGRPVGDTPG
ncbi:MAG: CBS domain-containing protein [Dehalococcoidia bacterium]|nr:CBS domain-containing protein [Dehalococcoidia bacterium]